MEQNPRRHPRVRTAADESDAVEFRRNAAAALQRALDRRDNGGVVDVEHADAA